MSTSSVEASAIVAGFALAVSLANFLWTVSQKKSDVQGGQRKQLTDLMFELTNISVAFEQINSSPNNNEIGAISMRRVLNSRRTFIAEYAERIAKDIDSLVSSVEFRILAGAWDAAGDREKARKYWERAVERSANPAEKIYCLRGLAYFHYWNGNSAMGRERYREASQIELPNSDAYRTDQIDTYLFWANAEFRYEFVDEARRQLAVAIAEIGRVTNAGLRANLIGRIKKEFPSLADELLPKD
jgi:tetratricopeptide (TPR) repeat protein